MFDGRPGDLVEDHPLHRHLRLEHLLQVPGDGLPFAVLIRREVELVGVLQQRLQPFDDVALVGIHLIFRLEVGIDVDRQTLRRQVADVPDGGLDDVVVTQELADRLGLGG